MGKYGNGKIRASKANSAKSELNEIRKDMSRNFEDLKKIKIKLVYVSWFCL